MAADASALAAVEAPEIDLTVQEPAVEESQPQEQPEKPAATEEKTDARRNPDAARKALKALAGLNNGEHKAAASILNRSMGRERAYSEAFPKVEDARAAKALLDSVGGAEGAQRLQSAYSKMEQIDSMMASGDPQVLDALFADDTKEGMTKLVGPMLDRIAQQNPQAYDAAITPHAMGFMEKSGLVGALNTLIGAFGKNDTETMRETLNEITKWYNGLRQNNQATAAKTQDPEREKFEKERSEFERKQHDQAMGEVFNSNIQHASTKIDELLKPYQSKLNLKGEALEMLRQDIWKHFEKKRNDSPEFKTFNSANYRQNKGYKDAGAAKQYLNNLVDMRMKESVDHMVQARYGAYLKQAAKPSPVANPGAKPNVVRTQPNARPGRETFEQLLTREVNAKRAQAN